MNISECTKNRWSRRSISEAVLPFAIALGVLGLLVVPISGVIFSVPILAASFGLIAARESRECRLLLQENR